MALDRTVKRYTGYFRGWCRTFGEHDAVYSEASDLHWLIAEDQIGLILNEKLRRILFHSLLGKRRKSPTLVISASDIRIGSSRFRFTGPYDQLPLQGLRRLVTENETLHIYLTYHLTYRSGTRIITLSRKPPLMLLYKEMAPMHIRVV